MRAQQEGSRLQARKRFLHRIQAADTSSWTSSLQNSKSTHSCCSSRRRGPARPPKTTNARASWAEGGEGLAAKGTGDCAVMPLGISSCPTDRFSGAAHMREGNAISVRGVRTTAGVPGAAAEGLS